MITIYHPTEFDGTFVALGVTYTVTGGVTSIDDSAACMALAALAGYSLYPQTPAQSVGQQGATGAAGAMGATGATGAAGANAPATRAGSVSLVAATSATITFVTPMPSTAYEVVLTPESTLIAASGLWITNKTVNDCVVNSVAALTATIAYIAVLDT